MTSSTFRLFALFLVAGACACTELAATNPYDPKTPADQQAKVTLSGVVFTPGKANGAGIVLKLLRGTEAIYSTASTSAASEQGAFQFDAVAPAEYRLVALSSDNPQFETFDPPLFIRVVAGENRDDLAVRLTNLADSEQSATLTGTVWLAGEVGKPSPNHEGIRVSVETLTGSALTDSTGAFSLRVPPSPPGSPYTVVMSFRDYTPAERSLDVAAGGTTTLSTQPIVLEPNPATIIADATHGLVLEEDETGALVPAAGATASLVGTSITATVDAQGGFVMNGVPAGTYDLQAGHGTDYEGDSQLVSVSGGEQRYITDDLILWRARGVIAGTVTLADGQSPAGAVVEVGGGLAAVADASGAYVLGSVPVGTYQVSLRKEGYVRVVVPESAQVTANSVVTIDPQVLVPQVGAFSFSEGETTSVQLVHLLIDKTHKSGLCIIEQASLFANAAANAAQINACYAAGNLNAPTFQLSDGEGPKTVYVQYRDTYGDPTAVYSATITYDQTHPDLLPLTVEGETWVAGDPSIVVESASVSVGAPWWSPSADAAYLAISETDSAVDTCTPGVGACSLLTTAQVFPLSGSEGEKVLYYRLFDRAKNESEQGEIHLKLVFRRPAPAFVRIYPTSVSAGADATVTVMGESLASDTSLRVGDFELLTTCVGNADGGATGRVVIDGVTCIMANLSADSLESMECPEGEQCLNCCQVALTSSSPLMRNAGSYLTRVITPAPVEGTGVSANSSFLNVVAPVPVLTDFTVLEAMTQACRDGDVAACSVPMPRRRYLRDAEIPDNDGNGWWLMAWGRGFMDNVSARVENVFGQVLWVAADPSSADPRDQVTLLFFTEVSLPARDLAYKLVVTNPSPGGGDQVAGIGVDWTGNQMAQVIRSTIRRTDINTKKTFEWLEAYGSPVDDLSTTATEVTPKLALSTADPRLKIGVVDQQGRSLYRAVGGSSWLAPPIGTDAHRINIEGPAGKVRVAEERQTRRFPDYYGTYSTRARGPTAEVIVDMSPITYITELAAADLNNDGYDDVIAGSLDHLVGVILGGNPAFDASQTPGIYLAPSAEHIVLADMNNDGTLDIVAAGSTLSVLPGDANATFLSAVTTALPGGELARAAAAADFNDDGILDLAVAGSHGVEVLIGDGRFWFTPRCSGVEGYCGYPLESATNSSTYDVEVLDINEDGVLDIAAIGEGNNTYNGDPTGCLAALLGAGNGTFTAGGTQQWPLDKGLGTGPRRLRTRLSGSVPGIAELHITSLECSGINCMYKWFSSRMGAAGLGGFETYITPCPLPGCNSTVDDVLFVDRAWTGQQEAIQLSGARAVAINQNRGGLIDLAAACYPAGCPGSASDSAGMNKIAILEANERPDLPEFEPWYEQPFQYPYAMYTLPNLQTTYDNFRPLAVGDVNEDGAPDVQGVDAYGNSTSIIFNNGAGEFPSGAPLGGMMVDSGTLIDLNADGHLDFVMVSAPWDTLWIKYGKGDGTFYGAAPLPPESTSPLGAHSYASFVQVLGADFDNEGHKDVVAVSGGYAEPYTSEGFAGGIYLFMYQGGSPAYSVVTTIGSDWGQPSSAVAGAFDGNANLDLVVADSGNPYLDPAVPPKLVTFDGNGDGTFTERDITPAHADCDSSCFSPIAVGAGYFDANASLDLALSVGTWGKVVVLLNNGNGTFTAQAPIEVGGGGRIQVIDLDRDGRQDLLVSGTGFAPLEGYVLHGKGDGSFAPPVGVAVRGRLLAADFNFDGIPELAATTLHGDSPPTPLTTIYTPTSPGGVTQELGLSPSLTAAERVVSKDSTADNPSTFVVHQAGQTVLDYVVKFVVEYDAPVYTGTLYASLKLPSGEVVALDDNTHGNPSPDGFDAWMEGSTSPAVPGKRRLVKTIRPGYTVEESPGIYTTYLALRQAWQPPGDWELRLWGSWGGFDGELREFSIGTRGQLTRTECVSTEADPSQYYWDPCVDELILASGSTSVTTHGSTSNYPDKGDYWGGLHPGTCGSSTDTFTGAPDRWYQFYLPAARTVTAKVDADFDATFGMFTGKCNHLYDETQVGACPASGKRVSFTSPSSLAVGHYCIIVDGAAASDQGEFDLTVGFDSPL